MKKNKDKNFRKIPPKLRFNFVEWNNIVLTNAFKKIGLSIMLIVALDALFYILSGYLVIYWLQGIQLKMSAISMPAPEQLVSLGYDKAQQALNEAKAVYYLIIFSAIILLIAIIFLASILKGVIWAKTTKTKISLALISKFLALNLVWMGFWLALIICISLFVQPLSAPVFMLAAIMLGMYFTNTLYAIFMKEQKLKSIIDAVKLNVAKIHLFALPYLVIFALLYVISKLSGLAKFQYSPILLGLVLLIYAAIVRYYTSELVSEARKLE